MRPQKSQKIDLNTEYPCPCRRRGRLLPITLTEAFGCDRCQQIFVLEDNGQVIEQLSSSYPYKRAWRWSGYRWSAVHPNLREGSLYLGWIISVLLLICLTLALQLPSGSMIFWTMMTLVLIILPTLVIWFAYRR